MKAVDDFRNRRYETQKLYVRDAWEIDVSYKKKREQIRILIREAHKLKYKGETFISVDIE